MGRIEIAKAGDDPRGLGRALMSDHNLSARLWATAALVGVPYASFFDLGWWFPIHLAMLGAVSQAIVGGQLMFSATLGMARGPDRATTLTQLVGLNVGAALVIAGRVWGWQPVLAVGATVFSLAIVWVVWQVHNAWRDSVNRRFAVTGNFYRLAGIGILLGGTIGAALGIGAFDDASSYLAHRGLHMSLNVLGWVGLTVIGTAITLLPTILHVRAPRVETLRVLPALLFGGLLAFATGASLGWEWLAGVGMVVYLSGLVVFGGYVRNVLSIPRRRRVPTAALHLIAALVWLGVTTVALVVTSFNGDHAAFRDFIVVGGAAGFVFQALLGGWFFLLPSLRAPIPDRRRRELVAMELAGRMQVIAYNAGLILVVVGLRSGSDVSLWGIVLAWSAAVLAISKTWAFPLLAQLPIVHRWSERWWALPENGPTGSRS